MNTLLNWK